MRTIKRTLERPPAGQASGWLINMPTLSWDLYEAIMETLEILSDEELMAALRQSIKEASEGQAVSWDRAKPELSRGISN